MAQSHSIGDGIVVLALVAAFLGYQYLKYRERQRTLEILHKERLTAIEKDIPLPELPLDQLFHRVPPPPDYRVMLIIGVVLLSFALGTMLMLWLLPWGSANWPAPLPIAFIGGGLIFAYFATRGDRGY
ncbi:MAG: hypothetical protein QM758_29645 [Armatimonas sp.]